MARQGGGIIRCEDVIVERRAGIGWITLNRPDKLNALRERTFHELLGASAELVDDPTVRVVVLAAAGEKAFSAGIDLQADGLPDSTPSWDAHTQLNARVMRHLWELDKPLITAVNGLAVAAGCNLALISDLTIAADSASFGEPEIRHGALSPLLLLPWLTSFKAMSQMYLTGDRVTANEAAQLGLVNRVVPLEDLDGAADDLARRVANAPLFGLRMAKRAIRLSLDIQGFSSSQTSHRYVDTMLLSSQGVDEKERLMDVLGERGMRAFLDERDGPYGER